MRPRFLAVAAVALLVAACNPDPTTGAPPPPGSDVPPFTAAISDVTAAELGSSWRQGCPVGPADLRALEVAHWSYDGTRRTGTLVVHRDQAEKIRRVMSRLYDARFQIDRLQPVSVFGGSDAASMAANNTSAFNCREVAGTSTWSEHAYGRSIDINPVQNPWVSGTTFDPPAGKDWADRTHVVPGMVVAGGPVVEAFAEVGWGWGGSWATKKDYQHFSSTGR